MWTARYRQRDLPKAVITLLASLVMARCCSAEDTAAPVKAQKYQLVEEWSVDAQGPVYLRAKSVKATYELEVTDLGTATDGKRTLEVKFVAASVHAEIPAQGREGQYDSQTADADFEVEHHELVRPMALFEQTLRLKYSSDGVLKTIEGTESAMKRLDEIYNEHLRGSEQDSNTRDLERERLSEESLRKAWSNVFLVRDRERLQTGRAERTGVASVMACIPSESWMKEVSVPVTESVTIKEQRDTGGARIEKKTVLAESKTVRTRIGDAAWKYDAATVTRETTTLVDSHGRVESLRSDLSADLASVLTLSEEIPIRMTIRHATELSKK